MSDYFCTGMQRPDNDNCRDNDRDDRRENCRDDDRDDRREHCRDNDRDDRCHRHDHGDRHDCCDRRDRCDWMWDDCRPNGQTGGQSNCPNDCFDECCPGWDRDWNQDRDRDDCRGRREECPCRRGMVQALQSLLRTGLSNLIDFQAFVFVTKQFLVGSPLVCAETGTGAYDNLADDLTGTFNRFTPCACDFVDVSGAVYLPNIECPGTGLTASRLNLCDIQAVAFTVTGDTEETQTENYQCARRLLQRLLQRRRGGDGCPPFPDPCDEKHRCDCDDEHIPGGNTSLVVGDLLLANVTVLGQVGRVLVLANDADRRFYFVCTDKAVFVR